MSLSSPPPHGGQLRAIAERFCIPASQLIDFSANINPDGPPASVIDSLQSSIRKHDNLSQYPDLEEFHLKAALAHYAGTLQTRVLVSNGFVPLLDAAIRGLRIHKCLLPVPCFVEYRNVLERNGVQVTPVVLRAEDNFRYEVDQLLASRHEAILFANPQNPSGILSEKSTLLDLVRRAAQNGTYILLDEAFIDYVNEYSMTSAIESFPNLIIFRSLTKCFGIPGLRAAYSVSHETIRPKIEAFLSPWSISTLASNAFIAAVQDTEFITQFPRSNELRKTDLSLALNALGIATYPAAANYLLLRFPLQSNASTLWAKLVTNYGIVLRSCENFEGLTTDHLRTAVRNTVQNRLLICALSSVLA